MRSDLRSTEVGDEDRDAEGTEEPEEALPPKGPRDPGEVAGAERAEHELTHQPLRPWCKWCVGGRPQHS